MVEPPQWIGVTLKGNTFITDINTASDDSGKTWRAATEEEIEYLQVKIKEDKERAKEHARINQK